MDARTILGSLVVGAVLVAGCGKKETPAPAPHGGDRAAAVKPVVKPVVKPAGGQQTTCAVMGGKINRKIYADHDGKRVYFCCNGCISAFKADPAKFVKKLEDAGVTLDKAPAGSAAESKAEGHDSM
ncbi:MAG: hypothetical protein ACYTKD_03745 [Planctomycetota bacterium]|jgi:YHS domain-containing protein